jgi:hypothetical protein
MSEATILFADQNSDGDWTVTALDSAGQPVTVFASNDALECTVWQGADSAALFHPTAAWISAPVGTIALSVTAAQTAVITPGVYPLEITALPHATALRLPILDAWFQVGPRPGSALQPPVYGTYQDLVDYGGGAWIETLRQKEGLANFVRERSRARGYLDSLICRKFRPWAGRTVHWSETTIVGPPDARNPIIRDYLAADYQTPSSPLPVVLTAGQTVLMVTDNIREIVALKALEMICRQRISLEADDKFLSRAAYFQALCRNRALCTSAELDINQDGIADYAFNLGIASIR